MVSRRVVQTILGLIWFLDGVFQLKPQMFTSAFIQQVILPTAQGQPHWIAAIVTGGASLVIGHIAFWNGIFAAIQLILGIALIFNFKRKTTIVFSIVWSVLVWVFGEGFGQLLTGQALLVNGAPGAALIYGLVSGAIWPAQESESSAWNKKGIRFAQLSLASLFAVGCVLNLQPTYLTSSGLSQVLALSWAAKATAHQGVLLSMILAALELAIAVMIVFKKRLQLAIWGSIALSLLFWWVGQSFGQVFDPLATDFNSGLLMVVLAICASPTHRWKTSENSQARQIRWV